MIYRSRVKEYGSTWTCYFRFRTLFLEMTFGRDKR